MYKRFPEFECIRCEAFVTDSSTDLSAQEHQMKDHLETIHPYWDFENIGAGPEHYINSFRQVTKAESRYYCPRCKTVLDPSTRVCPNCGDAATRSIEPEAEIRQEINYSGWSRRQLLGIAGSVVLFVGVFTPILSIPIVGSLNYFQNGNGDGVFILVLSVISIILVLTKKYGGLWFTGSGSFAVMLFTFLNFQFRIWELQEKMESDLAGNPFRGLADVAMRSIQLEWGWALLLLGAALVIAAAAVKDGITYQVISKSGQ